MPSVPRLLYVSAYRLFGVSVIVSCLNVGQCRYRRDMLELYLNDYLLPVQLMPDVGAPRVGIVHNNQATRFEALQAWAMQLPGSPSWPVTPAGDLSPGGTAACSGIYSPGFQCQYGTDGDLTTRWSSELPYDGSPRWLSVHFDTLVTVSNITLIWEKAYAKGYALQVANTTTINPSTTANPLTLLENSTRSTPLNPHSPNPHNNDLAWASFYNTTHGAGNTEVITGFGSITGTDFRIFCFERFPGSQWGFSLFEMELRT